MGLKIEKVSKYYGEKLAVDNISFEMNEPGVFGLLGTNGAWKNHDNKNDSRNNKKGCRRNNLEWAESRKKKRELWIFTRRKRNLSKNKNN